MKEEELFKKLHDKYELGTNARYFANDTQLISIELAEIGISGKPGDTKIAERLAMLDIRIEQFKYSLTRLNQEFPAEFTQARQDKIQKLKENVR